MSLYGNPDKVQNSRAGKAKQEIDTTAVAIVLLEDAISLKVTADGGTLIPPTSDPLIAGALWNDSTVLKVSAG